MAEAAKFVVVPEESGVLVEARSNVGPITFATRTLSGGAQVHADAADPPAFDVVAADLHVPVKSLESGNSLYDAELRRRLNDKRFPMITAELRSAHALAPGRLLAEGDVTIHDATRRLSGTVILAMPDVDTLVAYGKELIDIRDFGIEIPTMLMLKIYPDVSVQFRLTATRA